METSGEGLAANEAMARTLALPPQPVANQSLFVQRAQPAPFQTSGEGLSRRLHLSTRSGAFA